MENETKAIKYLFVDDNSGRRQSIQNFPIEGKLDIDDIEPTKTLRGVFEQLKGYDGLIVDQQLDENPSEDGIPRDYLGSSLAMEIRVKENESILKGADISMPIILYSANENVGSNLYGLGEEIFDFKIYKSNAEPYQTFRSKVPMYQKQMISLVNGYKKLKELKSDVCGCLGFDENLGKIDSRFLDELKRRKDRTAHSKASFILNELIIKQGILVDEEILAVRLGVDNKKSQEGWNIVLDSLKEFGAKYEGVFGDGWPRWWMPIVEKWWTDFIGEESYLQFMSASQRVQIISKKLSEKCDIHLDVVSAKSKFSNNDAYWTVCVDSKEPLALEDGVMLSGQDSLYPWQDAKYFSIKSAIDQSSSVADFEKERLDFYKQLLKQSK